MYNLPLIPCPNITVKVTLTQEEIDRKKLTFLPVQQSRTKIQAPKKGRKKKKIAVRSKTSKELKVCCSWCNAKFKSYHGSETQGYGCASFVEDDGIRGVYGSLKYDLDFLRYTDGVRPEIIKIGYNICDVCLTVLIEIGMLDAPTDNKERL
jgi:hypothetical protein